MEREETRCSIKVGDRVTYRKKEEYKEAINLVTDRIEARQMESIFEIILKVERIGSSGWYTVYEKQEKKELLTEDERKFLKLYLDLLKSVVHIKQLEKSNYETIRLYSSNETEYIYSFDISSDMFKKINENKRYTLSELGLE